MKKQILKSALIAMAGVGLLAGSAMAELTLQQVLTTYTDTGLTVGVDESGVEAWGMGEGDVDAYLVSLLSSASGSLWIYSTANPLTGYLIGAFNGTSVSSSFGLNDNKDLWINGSEVKKNFGDYFGFYWETTLGKSYTDNAYNNSQEVMALSYLIEDGYKVKTLLNGGTTVTAGGNNDWIIAFEDWPSANGGDADYQDAVLYFEDMNPVPEPATMLLFGTGLAGLAAIGRRRKTQA